MHQTTSRTRPSALSLLLISALCAATGHAGDEIRSERVYFAPGATGAVIAGSIEGRNRIDYLLGARAGQTLSVTMDTDNTANYFNVIPPDEENVADYAGPMSAEFNSYTDRLDLDGDWKIRVYLYRAAARNGERADYRLDVRITGEPDPSAAREANDFGPRDWDARGDLGCARGGQPLQTAGCPFKVIRTLQAQESTVFVLGSTTWGELRGERILHYSKGQWSTPTGDPIQATKREDIWNLTVGDEAYEIVEAVVLGG